MDIQTTYDTWSFRFSEHFDLKNGSYILGKIGSGALMFLSFLEFVTDFQAAPRREIFSKINNIE
jgi:hypothetical protein